MRRQRLLVFLIFILNSSPLFAKPTSDVQTYEKMRLIVGDSRTIHLRNALRVNVSRRGIIHILEGSNSLWHVTGIRTGVTAVEISERGGRKKTWYIEVVPKESHAAQSNDSSNSKTKVPDPPKITFNVKANIELIEQSTLESKGGKPDANLTLDLLQPSVTGQVLSKLESRDAKFNRRILASPTFRVKEGVEAIVKSGGESIHNREGKEGQSTSVWHEYGMSLSIRIHSETPQSTNADILFVLKAPSNQDARYSLNQIQTSSQIKLKTKTLLGTVDLATNDDSTDGDLFLSAVPFIGPLFRQTARSVANAIVQLWVEIY